MKVVHINRNKHLTDEDLTAEAYEKKGELDKAAKLYEKSIRSEPLDEKAYERLMIIYRKQKDYESEVRVIRKGISEFEKLLDKKLPGNSKVSKLSSALMRSTGLADKKGKALYEPEPLGRWRKRLITAEKKLK